MARFLVTYHDMPHPSPEVVSANRAAFHKWAETALGDALVDPGAPVYLAGQLAKGAPAPQTEISGFSIIEAKSLADARDLLADHPYLDRGATIQIDWCLDV